MCACVLTVLLFYGSVNINIGWVGQCASVSDGLESFFNIFIDISSRRRLVYIDGFHSKFSNQQKRFPLQIFSKHFLFFHFSLFHLLHSLFSKQIDFDCFWHFAYINRDHLKMIVDLNPKQSNWCLFRWIFITALAWIFYYYLLLKSVAIAIVSFVMIISLVNISNIFV